MAIAPSTAPPPPPAFVASFTPTLARARPSRVRHANRWAASVLAVTVAGVALSIMWSLRARGVPGAGRDQLDLWMDGLLSILPLGVAGALLIDRRPDLPFGWLLALGATGQTLSLAISEPALIAVQEGSTSNLTRWALLVNLWFVPEMVKGLVNLRFPSGRLQSRRARALEIAIVSTTGLGLLGVLFGSSSLAFDTDPGAPAVPEGLEHPLTAGTALGELADALYALFPITVMLGLVAGIGVLVRWRRATGVERQQLTWRSIGVIAGVAFFPLAIAEGMGFLARLDILFFVVTIVVPVLRHRLWSIDTMIRRSVAYAAVIAILVGVYAALVAGGSALAFERAGALLAAVVIAVAFAPLRDRMQRLVDRLFYGDRTDPYRALSDLGRRLEGVGPTDVAPTIVETVAASLRLPYVAVERSDQTVMAAHGNEATTHERVERWPLTFEGGTIAYLGAAPRGGEDAFDQRDRELLADVARHAGPAVHAAALTDDLVASRHRLVTAREEERRRLRRDLHDGLGPVLTAVGLNVDAARSQLDTPDTADRLLASARDGMAQAIGDLRRLVYGLRPPALDDLGLVGALRTHIDRMSPARDVSVAFRVGDLPPLPAAIEVAVYWTAIEGLHNAVRHGGARRCEARLHVVDRELVLDLSDDGSSTGPWRPGVGLTAMRERAEELGGRFQAGPRPGGGASVTSRFPLLDARIGPT